MIKLEKMSAKKPELDLIAEWRNESMISLRTNDLTAPGQSQIDWVNSFTTKEKYYFIYSPDMPILNEPIQETSKLLGYCGLDKIDPINRTAEMGLLIRPNNHGYGYGSKAIKELLKMAFMQFNLNCVFIEVLGTTQNWDFWLKQGFKYEGSLRARHFKKGRYYQSRVGSILCNEWFKQTTNKELND